MAYLTPSETTTVYAPFVVYLPVDDTTGNFLIEYAALLAGIMLALTESDSFVQFGTLTPEQTAHHWQQCFDLTWPIQECT